MTPPFVGAWEWLSDHGEGRTVFTERHFCYAAAPKKQQMPEGERPSDAEAAVLFKSFYTAVAGSFTATKQEGDEWLVDHIHLIDLDTDRVGIHEHNVCWVQDDRVFNQGFGDDGTRGPIPPHQYRRLSQLGSSSLAGTWELVSDKWIGLMIMTDAHYRYVMTLKDRPSIPGKRREMSDVDAAALYHSFNAQCGSYSVSGSILLRQPVVVKNPRDREREIEVDFLLDGEKLTAQLDQQELAWQSVR